MNAATARVVGMLGNGGTTKHPGDKEQLEQFDEGTLAQLPALSAATKKGGAPAN